jgi:dTDP-glucose pyrophosphorylase/predicted transcriptional regulator
MNDTMPPAKSFGDISLSAGKTLADALVIIERGSAQIALVVDDRSRLIGTVTDGDIRRGLLRGESLESRVERVMKRSFRSLSPSASESEALALMRRELLRQVPVLDDEGRVVEVFVLEELLRPRTQPHTVVLMAGGEGKRLRPFTADRPKPMLAIGGRPMLEIILERCIESGFQKFVISVNYLKHHVMEYFGDGTRWNVEIRYLEENAPLGTVGALSLLPRIPEHPVLVINGDILTRVSFVDLIRFHEEHEASATVCVREHFTEIPYGVVQIDGSDVTVIQEKPTLAHYVNAGIYLLGPDVLQLLASGDYCDMPQLLERAIKNGQRVSAFPIHEYWVDIGHPEMLERANGEW